MSDRPCSEWWPYGACVISARRDDPERSPLCQFFARCMYAAERSSFTEGERELLDGWLANRLCLLVYRP